MTFLDQLLDDVLTGRRVVDDRATFDLLRQIAPDKSEQLRRLEGEAIGRRTERSITPIERIRREMNNKPESAAPPTAVPTPAETVKLTRADLNDIIAKRRTATMAEIEWFLAHAQDYKLRLSVSDEHELRALASRISADSRVIANARQAANEEFVAKVLGTYRTAYGDLTRTEVDHLENIRRNAESAIRACRDHKRERCSCWASARAELFELRRRVSDKSPLGKAALAVWNSIETIASIPPESRQSASPEPPPGIAYNWRHFKSPEYVKQNFPEIK